MEFSPLDRPLLIACSGAQPGVMAWQAPGQARMLFHSRQNFSVYAVALSPDGRRVAAGTKPPGGSALRRGYLEVHPLAADDREHEPLHFTFPREVVAVAWLDGGRVAVGTLDEQSGRGCVRILRVPKRGQIQLDEARTSLAHERAVVAVVPLGETHLLTVGMEGLARIWRLADGVLETEFGSGAGGPPLRLLPAACVLPGGNEVLVQFPDGRLRQIGRDSGGTWQVQPGPADGVAVGGFTFLGDHLALTRWDDLALALFRYESGGWVPAGGFALGRPARALLALRPDTLAALHLDDAVTVWRTQPEWALVDTLQQLPVRGLGGGAEPAALAAQVARESHRQHEKRLAALQSHLEQAHDLDDLERHMQAICESGQGLEGLITLADVCRRRKKPLAELHVRRHLCDSLPAEPVAAMQWRLFGELLATLGEPALALEPLRRARDLDPAMAGDLDALLPAIEAEAAMAPDQEGDLCLVDLPGRARATESCAAAVQSVLRDLVAGHPAPRVYLVAWAQAAIGHFGSVLPAPAVWAAHLSGKLSGDFEACERRVFAAPGAPPRLAALVRHRPLDSGSPGAGFDAFIELHLAGGQWEYAIWLSARAAGADPQAWSAAWTRLEGVLEDRDSPPARRLKEIEEALVSCAVLAQSTASASPPANTSAKEDPPQNPRPSTTRATWSDDEEYL